MHLYSLEKWNVHKGYGMNILVTNIINLVAIKSLVVGSNCVLVVIRVTTIVSGLLWHNIIIFNFVKIFRKNSALSTEIFKNTFKSQPCFELGYLPDQISYITSI